MRRKKQRSRFFQRFVSLFKNRYSFLTVTVIVILVAIANLAPTYLSFKERSLIKVTKVHTQLMNEVSSKNLAFNPGDINSFTQQAIAKDPHVTVGKLSKLIQAKFRLSRVAVTNPTSVELYIRIYTRKPALTVTEFPNTFITEQGEVYQNNDFTSSRLRSVTGILVKTKPLRFNDRGLVELNNEQKTAIKLALKLNKYLDEQTASYQNLDYSAFRGFTLTATNELPIAVIGMDHFDERLARLKSILTQQDRRAGPLIRVELDYANKAFIQEKKM